MGKKKKLKKLMRKREAGDEPALVVCVGKKCADREVSRALVEQARAHARGGASVVKIAVVGCLHICEDGPVVATYPKIKFHRHVDGPRVCGLVDELGERGSEERDVGR